ncbi:MAG: aminoacetone oxidase family FAD-binding enzyme [Defluviitoga tunisiensis]|jgi:predicted Rossmann fold flavoprotein|uniref:Flavoprotein, HI0933 family n=1 Tax=Defluviitoga tunisiensis TaxID=1006576 RepID=A0A0C7NPN3_DEFTU|nr:aminoacetone oxidase family FAD-binding enzyme [Defluviitoga tunisiensis]CEP77857.1 flavoprotein, HI0933 family [Defluviitoga tunisiensis]HHV02262.1 aminoacetone oxidase family FAD-binding enzyme [Defluviitoga tunisiensis]HOB54794.1 aminoacetone oxidase family FAD-binding enzyme [Defluviitoga tunisiensis]HOK16014.1 aminoacetone oxidase family FAD-binding enzyme [Defluviitoga tunisiensis]HOL86074.1 aminoacetone oxidase family FAD-binding enzyme [Defluviitoga tunisiensis]
MITIIGGGPSGLMAAMIASWNGAEVRIVERKGKLGKKLLAASNGRGNFSNLKLDETHYFTNDTSFVKKVLDRCGIFQTLSVFEEIGLMVKNFDSKLFPYTERSKDILTCFIHELENNNVEIVLNYQINDIVYSNSNKLFYLKSEYKTFESEKVIVATGGMSAPQFGSNGSIFQSLCTLGHSLIELKPGLVPIIINDDFFSVDNLGAKLSGTVVLENAQGIEMSKKYFGEIIFKNEMLTGIPIFQISNFVHRYLDEKIPIYLHIDPFPSYTENQLEEIILKKINLRPKKPIYLLFTSMIDEKLIPSFLNSLGINDLMEPSDSLKTSNIALIANRLKYWKFEIITTAEWESSQVSIGGINTKEIESLTLESKIIPGLFFAGEVMDVAGESGGYNLQWAWSTGYIAGESASSHK